MAKNKKRKLNPTSTPPAKFPKRNAHKQPKPSNSLSKSRSAQKTNPTIPFSEHDDILLVGEGDFSFAASITQHHSYNTLTATCFDSESQLHEKYHPQAREHISYLHDQDQRVFYSVDATKVHQNKSLRNKSFTRILFNFPHVGGLSKDQNRQVRANQDLLVKFFSSALNLLAAEGQMVVTLFEGEPYTLWNIRDLARHSGLQVVRSFRFDWQVYPGYRHARTLGNLEGGGGWKGEEREARSFVFARKDEADIKVKKRKRDEDDSENENG